MPVDIEKLEALHAKATQGEWRARRYEGTEDTSIVSPEMMFADWLFICSLNNEMPALISELRQLREFESIVKSENIFAPGRSDVREACRYLDEQRKVE